MEIVNSITLVLILLVSTSVAAVMMVMMQDRQREQLLDQMARKGIPKGRVPGGSRFEGEGNDELAKQPPPPSPPPKKGRLSEDPEDEIA